jgi:Ca2+-binding EF-hand superfamily protein
VSAAAEHRDFDRVFQLLDANGDGVITRGEVEAALEGRVRKRAPTAASPPRGSSTRA